MLFEKGPAKEAAGESVEQLIQRHGRLTDRAVLDALHQIHGHRSHAAQLLGVSIPTLYRHFQRMRRISD